MSYMPISEAIAIVAKRRRLPVDRKGRCDPAWQLILTEGRCGELKMRYRGGQGAIPVRPALLNYVAAFGEAASTYPIQDTVWIDAKEAFRGGIEPPIPNHLPGLTVNRAQLDMLWPEPATTRPVDDAPESGRPGPKGQEKSVGDLAWQIAEKILADDTRRPARGYGRLMTLARLVNAELATQGHRRQDDSIAKMIRASLREWEARRQEK